METEKALYKVSAAISGLRNLDAILKIGLDNVLDIIKGDVGGIMLLDEETKTLSYRVYHNLSAKYAEEMRLHLGEGIAGKVVQNGKSKLVEDISLEPKAAYPSLINVEGLKAFISVPLQAKGNVLGVMNVASSIARKFSNRDMLLLKSIGDLLGIAVEQAKLYDQLKKSRERYRNLAQQILLAQEEERRRIARELHDETTQSLSGLALNLQALVEMAEMNEVDNSKFKDLLKKANSLAILINGEVSKIIADLRPTLLDTLGLIPAIRHFAETNLTPAGIKIKHDLEEKDLMLPMEMEAGLFRICQGSIGNILHHSNAKNVVISLKQQGEELVLFISDDGKGFDVSQITRIEESGRGAGLFSMKERTRLLGGRCSIESKPNQGTRVNVMVPLVREVVDAENKSISSR
jgi:signal transduction histidine kinase